MASYTISSRVIVFVLIKNTLSLGHRTKARLCPVRVESLPLSGDYTTAKPEMGAAGAGSTIDRVVF